MTSAFERHRDLTVGGGPIRHYQSGDSGPPVLLLHGGALDTAEGVWRNVAPGLADKYQVHAIDLPRHGASRPWSGDLGREFFDQFLDELLDELELPKVAIIGLSLGGGLGIGMSLRHPDRVSALITIGPGGLGAKRNAQFFSWLVMRTPGVLWWTSKYLARSSKAIRKAMISNLTAGADTLDFEAIISSIHTEAQAKAEHGERALDDWMINSVGPFRMNLDYLPELDQLAVPSLWIRGENDPLVLHPEMAEAARKAPGAQFVTLADAGHVVTYDQSVEFTRLADEFLETVLGRQNVEPSDGESDLARPDASQP